MPAMAMTATAARARGSSRLRMTVERFTAYVRNPRQMPPYSTKLLTDAQLGDVWAYIKSLPVSPDAKDIPLLARIMRGGK